MNQNVAFAHSVPASQGQRLLAYSKFLIRSSREAETYVRGRSMGSALPEGSRIRIRFADGFAIGQVVAYVAGDRIVAHRLVRIVRSHNEIYLITRGDACVFCDSPIRISAAMGIVTKFRNRGQWQAIAPKPQRVFVARLIESALSAASAGVLRTSPKIAIWIGMLLVQIRWVVMNGARIIQRHIGFQSSDPS